MSNKILVADDSGTIHKVIRITLEDTEYDMDVASNEEELFSKLSEENFDLIALDDQLSSNLDVYQLCEKIHQNNNDIKILLMIRAFDTVEEENLKPFGLKAVIEKPFNSKHFIDLVEQSFADTISQTEVVEEDSWSISGPEIEENSDEIEFGHSDEEETNPLLNEMKGWGMSVPDVIGGNQSNEGNLPDPIPLGVSADDDNDEEDYSFENSDDENLTGEWKRDELSLDSETLIPSEEDLDYPTLDSEDESDEDESDEDAPSRPTLISMDEIEPLDEDDIQFEDEIEATEPQMVITPQEDQVNLESELDDASSPEEFWAVDEISEDELQEDTQEELSLEDSREDSVDQLEEHIPLEDLSDFEEVTNPTIDALNALSAEESQPTSSSVNIDSIKAQLLEELRKELKPLIKEVVSDVLEELGKEASEKVAWEVIPDLAENLIRSEVDKISKKVQEKHSLN